MWPVVRLKPPAPSSDNPLVSTARLGVDSSCGGSKLGRCPFIDSRASAHATTDEAQLGAVPGWSTTRPGHIGPDSSRSRVVRSTCADGAARSISPATHAAAATGASTDAEEVPALAYMASKDGV